MLTFSAPETCVLPRCFGDWTGGAGALRAADDNFWERDARGQGVGHSETAEKGAKGAFPSKVAVLSATEIPGLKQHTVLHSDAVEPIHGGNEKRRMKRRSVVWLLRKPKRYQAAVDTTLHLGSFQIACALHQMIDEHVFAGQIREQDFAENFFHGHFCALPHGLHGTSACVGAADAGVTTFV